MLLISALWFRTELVKLINNNKIQTNVTLFADCQNKYKMYFCVDK